MMETFCLTSLTPPTEPFKQGMGRMNLGHFLQKARAEMSAGDFASATSSLNEAMHIALYVCMWPIFDQNVRNIQSMRHSAFRSARLSTPHSITGK